MSYRYPYDEENKEVKATKLSTNRSFWKFFFLNLITLGFYSIFFFSTIAYDLDKIDPRHDGSKTMSYLVAFLISYFTFGIVLCCWHYGAAKRVEEAMTRRNIPSNFGTGTFWGWFILGNLIGIGPFVYVYKLCRAMNQLCESYNENPVITE